jgi:hypothetical protein
MPFPYDFKFDLSAFKDIFEIVKTNEFVSKLQSPNSLPIFKDGVTGMVSRLHGVNFNYHVIHTWDETFPKGIFNTESYVASTLFNMDSALECCIFGLNALGFSIKNSSFINIENSNELKRIRISNVIGSEKQVIKGYQLYFVNFNNLWNNNKYLIKTIEEHHDVTKHRHFNLSGGGLRLDAPESILRKYNVDKAIDLPSEIVPSHEVLLSNNPKNLNDGRKPSAPNNLLYLENLAESFSSFLTDTGEMLKKDILELIGKWQMDDAFKKKDF